MTSPVMNRISVIRGDITEQQVDAIVNAANPSLSGGGGVDGAIHRAAGPELDVECRMLGGCMTGDAVMTKGYRLPARFVIHTVGPVWKGGGEGEDALLASCYQKALAHAESHDLKTIAFPAISTGAYGFPVNQATKIAVRTVAEYLRRSKGGMKVTFVCHSDEACRTYTDTIRELAAGGLNGDEREPEEPRGMKIETPGDIREQVAGQLILIETVYGIRITNRDLVIETIVRKTGSREAASRATAALNSWVAVKNVTGRVDIPDDILARVLSDATRR